MGFSQTSKTTLPLARVVLVIHLTLLPQCYATRKLSSLYQPPPNLLKYHKGALLEGDLHVSIFWYGIFSSSQKSIISDFLLSLNSPSKPQQQPSVSQWWTIVDSLIQKAGKSPTRILLSTQITDERCSLGKTLKKSDIFKLARGIKPFYAGLTIVLTSQDVAVEGFCMSNCGFHGSDPETKSVFIWVGNSVSQCPGQCAWPFHQPLYGPQTPPLIAPNGDVGADGMVINIASLLAGAVTNPFRNGYYQGPTDAPLEVASACSGIYGKGAYPGYAGKLLQDPTTKCSYNAHGVNGRKYLLPALLDPETSTCSTIV
ncbi:Protein EXORDIUM-like [Dillenia turbinata]|uniref:Protein EXORDIUM-like n=1 Tax=Dillenia turbinata TaxID=194707 RepID=A0AAN8VTW9_9MAGN